MQKVGVLHSLSHAVAKAAHGLQTEASLGQISERVGLFPPVPTTGEPSIPSAFFIIRSYSLRLRSSSHQQSPFCLRPFPESGPGFTRLGCKYHDYLLLVSYLL